MGSTPMPRHLHGVWQHLDTGTDPAELVCLLIHLDVDTRPAKRGGRGHAAHSGADDRDFWLRHERAAPDS
jgi:hypothetical protein